MVQTFEKKAFTMDNDLIIDLLLRIGM
jgi:hypothetical protein